MRISLKKNCQALIKYHKYVILRQRWLALRTFWIGRNGLSAQAGLHVHLKLQNFIVVVIGVGGWKVVETHHHHKSQRNGNPVKTTTRSGKITNTLELQFHTWQERVPQRGQTEKKKT